MMQELVQQIKGAVQEFTVWISIFGVSMSISPLLILTLVPRLTSMIASSSRSPLPFRSNRGTDAWWWLRSRRWRRGRAG